MEFCFELIENGTWISVYFWYPLTWEPLFCFDLVLFHVFFDSLVYFFSPVILLFFFSEMLLFYGWFTRYLHITNKYEILFFFELCKFVSQHDTIQHVSFAFLFNEIVAAG